MPYQRNFAEIIVPGGGLPAEELSVAVSERWQSGRMRVFAKDVSGQKLDRGFESRPLRLVGNRRIERALFPRLFEQRVMFDLRDCAETVLITRPPRDHRGTTLLNLC